MILTLLIIFYLCFGFFLGLGECATGNYTSLESTAIIIALMAAWPLVMLWAQLFT